MNAPPRASLAASPVSVRPPHETVLAALEAAARDDAGGVTFHAGREPRRLGTRDLLAGAWRWSALLRRRGVRRGDRVAILVPTSPAFVEALLGAMLAGAVPVPLASPMTFGSLARLLANVAAVARDCDARALVTYPRVRDDAAAPAALAGLRCAVLTEADLEAAPGDLPPVPSVGARDAAFLQYTSGTTGRPRGAVISHGALAANAFSIAHGLGITAADVGVSWLPMFHDMGLIGVLLTGLCHPYPLHVMSPESFLMRPARWLSLVAAVGGTLSSAPNFAYELCVARGEDVPDLSRWRAALNGAEPVLPGTARRFAERYGAAGFDARAMLPVYGLAENTLAVTFPAPGEGVALSGGREPAVSVGRPVAGTTVAVTDDRGRPLPEGAVGEVRVTGPSLMDGYFNNDEASAAALVDGWLRTGDLGLMEAGRLHVVGRAKDVVIKGGRNVYPHDVEGAAAEVAGVRAGGVAAVGRPNTHTGTEDLVVVVETAERDEDRRAKLAKEVRGAVLAALGFGVDDVRLWPVGALPRTTSGKVRRRECARMLAEER